MKPRNWLGLGIRSKSRDITELGCIIITHKFPGTTNEPSTNHFSFPKVTTVDAS